jgi:hypothetical protein
VSKPRRKRVKLAEAPGPPEALEAAIEARTGEVYFEHYRAAADGRRGLLSPEQMRELEQELRLRLGGHAHGYAPSLPAPEPTQAEPGSAEKIRVMRRRFLAGQTLHHPLDKKLGAGVFAPGLANPGQD